MSSTSFAKHFKFVKSFLVFLSPSPPRKALQSLDPMAESALSTETPSDSAFSRSLEGFRRRLSAEDLENFELTTFESLELAIKDIQRDQAQRRVLRNLNKIKPFLRFLQDYARVIEQLVSAKPDFLAFIWVSTNASFCSSLPFIDTFEGTNQVMSPSAGCPSLLGIEELMLGRSHRD